MWKKWVSSDELVCRIQREYPLPEGIQPNPESSMKLLKILARVAPEQQFIKTANLIHRVLEKKTDECLKNGYMFAMSCGDYRTAQTCLNILRNKDDLSPLFKDRPEELSCLDSGSSRIDASSSILPPNSVATDQVSAVELKNDSINKRLCEDALRNDVTGPEESNSIRRPLEVLDHPHKPMRGRKHRFSEPKVQTRNENVNISSESESGLSPRPEKQTSKQTLVTDRGCEKGQRACSKTFSREYDSDGDKSHSKNYSRSKSKLEDTDSEIDTGRSRSTKKRQLAEPLSSEKPPCKCIRSGRSKSSFGSSISPSPTKRIARGAPIRNKTRRVVHSDSDVLENSSKRKPALSNKNMKSRKLSRPKNQPPNESNISSESDHDLSSIREKKSRKQSSLSRKNEVKKSNLNKIRPGSSEQSESEDSEDLFRPSYRKRPIARPKHQSIYNKNKYSDSGEYSSPERNPSKNRRLSRQQSSSDSDSDHESKKLPQNHKTNNKRLANRQRVSREMSKDSKSDGNNSFSNKDRARSSDSEVDNARGRPSKKRQVADCSDSEQPSRKQVRSKRSKSSHDLSISPSPNKPKARQMKNKTKRAVHSDTDVTLGNSSKKKSVNKSKKELSKSQEKVSLTNLKKQAPKKPSSRAKKPTVKSVKESTVKKSGSGNKKAEVDVEKELPNPNESGKGSSKLNSSQFMSRLKELQSSILNNTPDPLTEKKAKNSKKSPVASKADDSASGKKPLSNKRKKSPIKSASKTEPKSSKAKIPDKTQQPDVAKKPRKKPATVKGKKVNEKKSPAPKKEGNAKAKAKNTSAPKKKTNEKKPVKKGKGKEVKEAESNTDKLDQEEDKTELSLLASDHSFMSDSELEIPMGSLSTCLNSIKRQMPRPLGSATPPLSIFLRANSDIMSDVASDTSSFDRVPLKLDDKNIVKRMAKANKPVQVEDIAPSQGKTNSKITNTPEALRKVVNIKKKLEEQQESDFECSSFSDC